jgi:regulator of cell morphogenesis and NO signaling
MILKANVVNDSNYVSDIVAEDYRTSYVFRKYNIDYCCGVRLPLSQVCEIRGLKTEDIKKELQEAMRVIHVSSSTNFNNWSVDFLIDYIINVHHSYLKVNLPQITNTVEQFAMSHLAKYPYSQDLLHNLLALREELIPHIEQERKVIFPYIKQLAHAYESREPYARLLVRTLRKPLENVVNNEHESVRKYIYEFRKLTHNYSIPASACITHRVALSKLKELDEDLVQHVHLKNIILFPKAVGMEKQLLESALQ